MEYKNDIDITQTLIEMGFNGKLLIQLIQYITDNETMQDFYNFIILKGDGMTKVLLVHNFIIHMQDKHSFQTCKQFEDAYLSAHGTNDKRFVIERLLALKASISQLNKIQTIMEKKNISLPMFYALIVKYRKMYSVSEIITLLETIQIA
ncbi:hypothetical protein SAMN04487970_1016101 [Paenibacillus tianmuensis]|uniref:Uncharacterized protein n=1 Tax=Paenibacillus tianmuensis TaxID=624147 RepID=A0A1G4RLD9_9BACL|nr:hypothetical protein [Paenibacillus tianmuensis]SCW57451.1 hypothetical protein SAMN04487970_1016101 [Paenibacillus tianmuensis]